MQLLSQLELTHVTSKTTMPSWVWGVVPAEAGVEEGEVTSDSDRLPRGSKAKAEPKLQLHLNPPQRNEGVPR